MSELSDLAVEKLIREVERSMRKHPDDNPYYQAVVKLAEDSKRIKTLLQSC